MIMKKISERAKTRGMTTFLDTTGTERRFEDIYNRFTMRGQLLTNEDCLKEMAKVNEATGVIDEVIDIRSGERTDGPIAPPK